MATGQITTALKRWITRPNADYFPTDQGGYEIAVIDRRHGVSTGTYGIEHYGNGRLRWTNGRAVFVLDTRSLPLLDHAIISIWGLAPEHGTPFSVLVGNREVHRSELNGTPLEIRVPLAEHRGSPRLRIELVSDTFISPPDQRILGIPLRSIRLIEVRDSAA